MPAGATYTPLATTTLGSATTSYTFSSISGSYTDLVVIFSGKQGTATDFFSIQVNGDTGSNYSLSDFYGSGSSAGAFRASNVTKMGRLPVVQDSMARINFMNYSNTTTYKTILSRGDSAADSTHAVVGLWRSTSAITSITLVFDSGGTFAAGSQFTLYGIAAA